MPTTMVIKKLATSIVKENNHDINSLSNYNGIQHDSGKSNIGCNWKVGENLAYAKIPTDVESVTNE